MFIYVICLYIYIYICMIISMKSFQTYHVCRSCTPPRSLPAIHLFNSYVSLLLITQNTNPNAFYA